MSVPCGGLVVNYSVIMRSCQLCLLNMFGNIVLLRFLNDCPSYNDISLYCSLKPRPL